MKNNRSSIANSIAKSTMLGLFFVGAFAQSSFAQNSRTEVVIGTSAAFTGRTSASIKAFNEGAQIQFDIVNKRGGIGGRKIIYASLDDGNLPELVVENTKRLLDDDKAIALFGYAGDATVNAALPIIAQRNVALVGAITGAQSHRSHPNLFPLRASYHAEVEKIVGQNLQLGKTRFAIFYQNDEFGKDVVAGLEKSLAKRKLTIASSGEYARNSINLGAAVTNTLRGNPQAIIMACTLEACAEFVRQSVKLKSTARLNHLASIDAGAYFKELGSLTLGLELTHVVPLPTSIGIPVINDFSKDTKEVASKHVPSLLSLEGYLAAKVMVEALRRAGNNPTRAKVLEALNNMGELNLNGFSVSYAPSANIGSTYADISIIGPGGRLKN